MKKTLIQDKLTGHYYGIECSNNPKGYLTSANDDGSPNITDFPLWTADIEKAYDFGSEQAARREMSMLDFTEHGSREPVILGSLLTIELAKSLIGKTIEVAYITSTVFECPEVIELTGVEERDDMAIGQSTTHYLLFKKVSDLLQPDLVFGDEIYDYYYEWQGIFRATGSAHKVYLKKVIVNN